MYIISLWFCKGIKQGLKAEVIEVRNILRSVFIILQWFVIHNQRAPLVPLPSSVASEVYTLYLLSRVLKFGSKLFAKSAVHYNYFTLL